MNARPFRRAALALFILACTVALPQTAERRPITEKDLFKFVWVADPQISPDGSQVAFVRVSVDEKTDQYDSAIWIAKSDGSEPPRRLSGGTRDHTPRWSADSARLAFVRAAEKDSRVQPPQIYVMAMAGGEGRAITEMPRGAGNPVWSPDGRSILFSSSAFLEELEPKPAEKDDKTEKPRQSDVRVITRAVYRANGVSGWGYVDPDRPGHIWTVTVPATNDAVSTSAKPKRLTSGEFGAANHRWSNDGTQIYFTADRRPEPYYLASDSDLYAVGKDGGEPARIASIDGNIGAYAPSPDGRRLAFVGTHHGTPERSYSQPDLWVVDLPSGTPRNLTDKYDFDVNGSLGGDQRAPRGAHPATPAWTGDGRSILIRAGEQGDANLLRIDAASGRMDPVVKGRHDIMSYTTDAAGNRIAFVKSTATVVGDLYVAEVTWTIGVRDGLVSADCHTFQKLALVR